MTSMKGKNCSLERMLKMQMKNLFKPALLACAALFALASCSAEQEPQASQNISSGPGEIVKVSLSVAPPTYDGVSFSEPEDATSGAKALGWNDTNGFPFKVVDATSLGVSNSEGDDGDSYRLRNGRSKVAKIDKDILLKENPNRDILLMIRKEGNAEFAYHQASWRYNEQIGAYEIKGAEVTLPQSWGTLTSADKIYGRVITGAKYDASNNTLEVEEHLSELDLSKSTTLTAQVPFASSWVQLDRDATDGRLYIAQKTPYQSGDLHNNRMAFKPLGMLILFSFRNTDTSKAITFPAVRVLSNQLLFSGKYDLTKIDLECTPPDDETSKSYVIRNVAATGDRFREKTFTFSSPLTLPRGRSRSDRTLNNRVFVAWAAPVAGKESIGANLGGTADGVAQTMVFAVDVKDGNGRTVEYPNYTIAPVMGTNRALQNGKTYAINSEFYGGAEPILGYYAQYTVNADATGFDTSHDPSRVSLVHYKKARAFVGEANGGVDLPRPDGTGTNKYIMGGRGSASLLTLLFGFPFNNNPGSEFEDENSTTTRSLYTVKGSTEFRARNAIAFPKLVVNRSGVYEPVDQSTNWFYSMYARRVPYDGVGYMIIGRRDGGLLNRVVTQRGQRVDLGPTRSNGQAFYRIQAEGFAEGRIYQLRIKSFATGKYFVGGTYAPIYEGKTIMDESLWNDPVVLQGGWAERIIPAAGNFNTVTAADYESVQPATTTRTNVGTSTNYWFDTGYFTNYLMAWSQHGSQASERTTIPVRRGKDDVTEAKHVQLPADFSFNADFISALEEEQNAMQPYRSLGTSMNLYRRPKSLIGYYSLNGASIIARDITLPSMSAFIWMALLPYSKTYQGKEATVPSHER